MKVPGVVGPLYIVNIQTYATLFIICLYDKNTFFFNETQAFQNAASLTSSNKHFVIYDIELLNLLIRAGIHMSQMSREHVVGSYNHLPRRQR